MEKEDGVLEPEAAGEIHPRVPMALVVVQVGVEVLALPEVEAMLLGDLVLAMPMLGLHLQMLAGVALQPKQTDGMCSCRKLCTWYMMCNDLIRFCKLKQEIKICIYQVLNRDCPKVRRSFRATCTNPLYHPEITSV